jgi:EF-hand domain pair
MSGISSLSGLSTVVQTLARPVDTSKLQQTLLEKIDSNGDQAIDKTELSSFLQYVRSKTGADGPDVDTVFDSLDANGNGSVSLQELTAPSDTLIDQLKAQLRDAQIGSSQVADSAPPPPPPPGPPPESTGDASSNPLDIALASLIQQYQAVSAGNTVASSVSGLLCTAEKGSTGGAAFADCMNTGPIIVKR